jgi:hypothetical protein
VINLEELTYGGALTKLRRLGVNIIGAPLDNKRLPIAAPVVDLTPVQRDTESFMWASNTLIEPKIARTHNQGAGDEAEWRNHSGRDCPTGRRPPRCRARFR